MRHSFVVSGMDLNDPNRGTAALGYGAISFLKEKNYIDEKDNLLFIRPSVKFWKYKDYIENCVIQGNKLDVKTVFIWKPILDLYLASGISLPFTKLTRIIKEIKLVAAINGGDGFSDIYNTKTFINRLSETILAIKAKIPYVILPQTLGPFKSDKNYNLARKILKGAQSVFVRDDKFVNELKEMGVQYEITKDLSFYMKPEPWDINILPNSIGLNISGLCYSNSFRDLSGQFDAYPSLIDSIIKMFQDRGKTIYLIPHSYCYEKFDENNDDIEACRLVYEKLSNKENIILIDRDMISPQIKYVISQMSFFIGTRMHANFAAIYTGIPLFGLAYSYKFSGAFDANGLSGANQTSMINNITTSEIPQILQKIDATYHKYVKE